VSAPRRTLTGLGLEWSCRAAPSGSWVPACAARFILLRQWSLGPLSSGWFGARVFTRCAMRVDANKVELAAGIQRRDISAAMRKLTRPVPLRRTQPGTRPASDQSSVGKAFCCSPFCSFPWLKQLLMTARVVPYGPWRLMIKLTCRYSAGAP
jgi:hypothetical protein